MGSKGNKQTTQTAQTQAYSADPRIQQAGAQALTGAESAAQSPFAMPVAPVAGFNPFQQQAFNQVQGAQGMTDPYFQQASQYMNQSAQPLTDVSQYFNPMTSAVTAQLQNIFGQQNRMATANATQAAGGVGADRIGVAQGNLANQQTLGAGQVYSQLYGQAQAAAQADAARKQAAGYGIGQLGSAAQAANLQATSALGGAGNQQQQLAQQQLNAPYQNILAQIAYPFQTSQFLAGITGGLAPALGGTTSGYGTSQTQLPTPSPLNQILGVGTAGIGALGSAGAFGTGNGGSQIGSTYGATNNGSGFGYGSYGGTQVPTYFAEGGSVDSFMPRNGQFSPWFDVPPSQRINQGFFDIDSANATRGDDPALRAALTSRTQGYADGGETEDPSSPPPFPYLSLPKTGASPIPNIRLPMGGGQFHNNLNLSPPTPAKSDSGSSGLGDVAKLASTVLPFVLARGGAVSPYAMGEGFADGGDTDEDSGNPFDASYVYSVPGAPIEAPDVPLPRGKPDTVGGIKSTMANEWSRAGLSPTGLAGINRNVADESGFNPYERHFDQPNPRFRGTEAQNSHGLYQEGGDEWNNYKAWIDKNAPGSDWRDPALQSRFTAENLKTNYPQVWDRMNSARSPGEAATAFMQGYLKPAAGPMAARTAKYLGDESDDGETNISARERQFNPYAPANTDMNIGQYHLPKADQPYPDALNRDWGQNAARSPWMSLIHAGAAIASTTGPVGTAIAKGIGAGAGALENQRKELRTEQDQNMKADHLFQQAQMHLDEYTRMKPGEIAKQPLIEAQTEHLRRETNKPFPVTPDPITLAPRFGIFDPNSPNGIKVLTDQELQASEAESPPAPIGTTPGTPQEAAPLATSTIAPTNGRLIASEPNSMIDTSNVSKKAQTNPDVLKAYPTQQLRGRAIAAANKEADAMTKEVKAAETNRQRSLEMRGALDTISNFIKSHPNDKLLNALITPGATGEQRQNILNKWATIPGNKAPQDVVAAINLLGKDSILAGFTNITATGLSAREAQPIIRAGMSAVANFNLPEQSSRALLASMDAATERVRDAKAFFDAYKIKNAGMVDGWHEAFEAQNPPEKYVAKSIYSNLPPEAKQTLPRAVTELRGARDQVIAAEKSGDQAAIEAARKRYATGKLGFDRNYGGLSNYFAFGTF